MGWTLDYKRFRVWLSEKFQVKRAYLFLGYVSEYRSLYATLRSWGYHLVFKPTMSSKEGGGLKGNCDAELVLQAMIDFESYDRAIIVTGDGDFRCLVNYLCEQHKLREVIAPASWQCSKLLKQAVPENVSYLSHQRSKLEFKRAK